MRIDHQFCVSTGYEPLVKMAWPLTKEEFVQNGLIASAPPIDEIDCTICYREWDAQNRVVIATPCNHIFDQECLLQWFDTQDIENSNTCPKCRIPLFGELGGNWEQIGIIFWVADIHSAYLHDYGIDLRNTEASNRFLQVCHRLIEDKLVVYHALREMDSLPSLNDDLLRCHLTIQFMRAFGHEMTLDQWLALNLERGIYYRRGCGVEQPISHEENVYMRHSVISYAEYRLDLNALIQRTEPWSRISAREVANDGRVLRENDCIVYRSLISDSEEEYGYLLRNSIWPEETVQVDLSVQGYAVWFGETTPDSLRSVDVDANECRFTFTDLQDNQLIIKIHYED